MNNEKKKEKWKPVHEVVAETLEEEILQGWHDLGKVRTIVDIYGYKKAKAPLKGIPRLIKVFKKLDGVPQECGVNFTLAITNLEQQKKEEKEKEKEKKKKEFKVNTIVRH